jgi:hypothetical protein
MPLEVGLPGVSTRGYDEQSSNQETLGMAAPVTTGTHWQWPADVVEFAARNQVQSSLDPLLESIQRLFPTAVSLRAYLDLDPELLDEWHIVFDVRVPVADVPNFVEAVNRWNRESFGICPAPLVCIFRLLLILVSP